jgi:hypothetical protein
LTRKLLRAIIALSAGERVVSFSLIYLFHRFLIFRKMTVSTDKTTDAVFELLEKFNFERVEKLMHAVDWKWGRFETLRAPTIDEMRDHCISLLFTAKRDLTTVSSGGFEAGYKINDEDEEVFTLRFVATENYIRF